MDYLSMDNKFLIKLLSKQIEKIKLLSTEKNSPNDYNRWKKETLKILSDSQYKHSQLYKKLDDIKFQLSISFFTEEERQRTLKMIREGSQNSVKCLKDIIKEIEIENNSEKKSHKKNRLIYGLIIPIILIVLTISSSPWWWPKTNPSVNDSMNGCYLTLIPDRYRIDIRKNGTVLDTLKLKFYADSCDFILQGDFQIKKLRFNNENYFYKDAILKPSLKISDVIYYSPVIKGKRTIDSLALEIKREILFDGYKIAWFKKNDKTQIGDFWLEYSYKINDQLKKDSSKIGIYLITTSE